jgi:hypothetical protein
MVFASTLPDLDLIQFQKRDMPQFRKRGMPQTVDVCWLCVMPAGGNVGDSGVPNVPCESHLKFPTDCW